MTRPAATHVMRTWSCQVRLVVDDPQCLPEAVEQLTGILDAVDRAASRFRDDSALSSANRNAGRPTAVPVLLVDLVSVALAAARRTDGAVDPCAGQAVIDNGYDRDIAEIALDGPDVEARRPVASWRDVRLDRGAGLLTVPRGSALDLGATAKAATADRAAATLARRFGTAVLVELGGDLAVAGERPGGWPIRVAEADGLPGEVVVLAGGGIATSTTTIWRWRRGGVDRSHIVDPATGRAVDGPWRTATVAARSALEANTLTTAALVLGERAPAWLEAAGATARLVGLDGTVRTVGQWPADPAAHRAAS